MSHQQNHNGTPPTSLPVWVPPEGAPVESFPCGRWWDAVRVPTPVGLHALRVLDELSGPVIEDQGPWVLYWLVPPGSADHWRLAGVKVLGAGHMLAVPPADYIASPSRRWKVPLKARGNGLTDPAGLHAALAPAVLANLPILIPLADTPPGAER